MDKGKMRLIFLTGWMACFCFLVPYAQPIIKTSVDKNEILIGDQFKLTIKADFSPEDYKINWPVIADSLPHFEVVGRSKIDSLYSKSRLASLSQTLTLTSFDSGKWVLPSFLVNMVPAKNDTAYNLFTDSVPITVSFSTADTTHQLRDIKPIREADPPNYLWYWIGGGLLLLAIIVFLVWFFKFRKKDKAITVSSKIKITAYEEAMQELQHLKSYNLSLPAEIKIVHTKLGEILKQYLSRTQKSDYQTKTTADILISLRDHFLDKDMPAKAAACLRCSDAVKFAKYLPPVAESEECMQLVKDLINDIQQQTERRNSSTVNPAPKI